MQVSIFSELQEHILDKELNIKKKFISSRVLEFTINFFNSNRFE